MGETISRVAVIGAGPAGLMAAETLSAGGVAVDVYDSMPSAGRKFLMAGRGGLNLTHSEPYAVFSTRYGRATRLAPIISAFGPEAVRGFVHGLGLETFVGSSGRVFPTDMKAAPLLRAWLRRLRSRGVAFHMRHRWLGWEEGALVFTTPHGDIRVTPRATVLALGGASWPQLGSDAAWVPWLAAKGVAIAPLKPANCGFDVAWSDHFRARFSGAAVKSIAVRTAADGRPLKGECVITAGGIEGGVVYALSASLRDAISASGTATLTLDLAPGRTQERLARDLDRPRGKISLPNYLRKYAGLEGVKAALLREVLPPDAFDQPKRLVQAIKALPLTLVAPRPIAEAISTAGGVGFEALDPHLMLSAIPGVFCAGEMLDWEAPTGGYLLTACLATGRAAGAGVLRWLGA